MVQSAVSHTSSSASLMSTVPEKGIRLRRARHLHWIAPDKRLEIIAKGLPIILASAQSLWCASRRLGEEMPRESGVLRGFAAEEAAKALILIDAVRCPRKRARSRLRSILGWFYDHLARLIYAESVVFPRVTVRELREHVELHRKDFYSNAPAGEMIFQNQHLYRREGLLYADVLARELVGESDELSWSDPFEIARSADSVAAREVSRRLLQLVEAMATLGIFSLQGLKATSEVWNKVEFAGPESHSDAMELVRDLVDRLVRENLPKEDSVDLHLETLYNYWRLPMYNLDFKKISSPK